MAAGAESRRSRPGAETAKAYLHGTHRIRPPDETWAAWEGLRARVGITRVADVTGLDGLGIPVFQAVRPASRTLAVSQGKGGSRMAARVGALMESLEVWHAERIRDLPHVVVPLREMESTNRISRNGLRWVPRIQVTEWAPIPWVRAASLLAAEHAWLPVQMLELDFRVPATFEPLMFRQSSTGLASGNCVEEALLHGLCEVVERHGSVQVQNGRHVPRAIDLDSLDGDVAGELLDHRRAGRLKLAVWDATWEDVGLPLLIADLVAPDLSITFRGYGCHTSREVALSRALTEAVQSRLTYISAARDDVAFIECALGAWTYEAFDEPAPDLAFGDLPDLAGATVAADLANVVGLLEARDLEPFWVDLTREELGVPVTIVYVPGLEEPIRG